MGGNLSTLHGKIPSFQVKLAPISLSLRPGLGKANFQGNPPNPNANPIPQESRRLAAGGGSDVAVSPLNCKITEKLVLIDPN